VAIARKEPNPSRDRTDSPIENLPHAAPSAGRRPHDGIFTPWSR